MIVTVTLNPALDLTYAVDALVPHGTHRVTTVAERPGGKGLNVARVLHTLGEPVLATGFLGGATGRRVTDLLTVEGVAASFVDIAGETRRTVAVVDSSDATGFWEPGPTITPAEWSRFATHFRALLSKASVVTLSGSLPPGLPPSAYADLIAYANEAGVPTLLDASGPPLHHGLLAAPTLAKPNAEELAALLPARGGAGVGGDGARGDGVGEDGPHEPGADGGRVWRLGVADVVEAVRAVASGPVVVSRGAAGLVAVVDEQVWECAPPVPVDGNPTGAGDACVAALSRGLRDRTPWAELLGDAVALSAAAVAAPVAGAFDREVYRRVAASTSGGLRVRTYR